MGLSKYFFHNIPLKQNFFFLEQMDDIMLRILLQYCKSVEFSGTELKYCETYQLLMTMTQLQ